MASLVTRFPGSSNSSLDRGFLTWVAVLTLACLWPIWAYRFLPMQDYPQHLFIAQVLSTYDSPDFDWQQNYELNSSWSAYSLTYGLLRLFSALTNIEAAGKLLTSLYVLLMALLVLRAARDHSEVQAPWALLFIFPFVFNQTYFLGFQSYLLSIPLLFLALMDLADSATHPTTLRSALYQFGILVLLFLTHPFGVLTYLVFGLVMALFHFRDRTMFRKTVIPLVLVTLAFVVWFVISSTQANGPKYNWEIQWLSAREVTTFYISMFTGMRWFNGVNFYAVALWASAFGLLVYFAAREWKHLRVSAPLAALLTLTLLGYATLPYWIGYYAFFNLRLAPITYVLLAWIFTGVHMPHAVGQICATLAAGLVAISINLHATISAETEQLLPILAKMEKNSAVLPILLDSHTTALDSEIFPELHANDHYYYHVLVGGGVNPLPFPNPMLPVHLRRERGWPTPKALEQFLPQLWQELISKYRYLLIRSNPAQPIQQLLQFATLVEQSGPWTLLETRNRIDTPIKGSP